MCDWGHPQSIRHHSPQGQCLHWYLGQPMMCQLRQWVHLKTVSFHQERSAHALAVFVLFLYLGPSQSLKHQWSKKLLLHKGVVFLKLSSIQPHQSHQPQNGSTIIGSSLGGCDLSLMTAVQWPLNHSENTHQFLSKEVKLLGSIGSSGSMASLSSSSFICVRVLQVPRAISYHFVLMVQCLITWRRQINANGTDGHSLSCRFMGNLFIVLAMSATAQSLAR
jgi:hypothetical protein